MKGMLKRFRYGQPGFTFLELVVASVILVTLLSLVVILSITA